MNPAQRLITLAAIGLAPSAALAQTRAAPPRNDHQAVGVPAAAPARMPAQGGTRAALPGKTTLGGTRAALPGKTTLGGTRATFPGPTTLGGVRATLPRQTATPGGTFGNPQPDWRTAYRHPMPLGPLTTSPIPTGGSIVTITGPGGSTVVSTPGAFVAGPNGFGSGFGSNFGSNFGSGFGADFGQAVISSESGVSIRGRFSGDHFRVGFHVGNPFSRRHDWCSGRTFFPTVVYPIGYPWWNTGYSYYPRIYDTSYGTYAAYDPNLSAAPVTPTYQAVQQPVAPSTDRELGDAYLRAGDAKEAVKAYRRFLAANPRDAAAMRALALALIERSEFRDGTAMMSLAYSTEPSLAGVPVAQDVYAGGAPELRDNLGRISIYANRVKTPSAWLSLAVLMQAEGRSAVARSAIDKAQGAGLDPGVAEKFRSAL